MENVMDQTKNAADKIKIAREYLARVFNEHKPDRSRDYVTSDVVWHGGSLGTVRGAEALAGLLRGFIGALPDLQAEEQDVIASGGLVMLRLFVTGRAEGELVWISGAPREGRWGAI